MRRTQTCLYQLREIGIIIVFIDHERPANVNRHILVHDDAAKPDPTSLFEFRGTKDRDRRRILILSRTPPTIGIPVHTKILSHADSHADQGPCKCHSTNTDLAITHEKEGLTSGWTWRGKSGLEEELGRVEIIFASSPHGETVCWERGSGVGSRFWRGGRGECTKVEVPSRSIVTGSNREHSEQEERREMTVNTKKSVRD